MEKTFEEWLTSLDLEFWGTVQHKISAQDFFELYQKENAVLLDVRTQAEIDILPLPFALHIPINLLPQHWQKIPRDRAVAAFCSSGVRAALAFAFLRLKGYENIRVLEGGLNGIIPEFMPPKVMKRLNK